ncbi:amino acid permease [Candidatus Nitrososphaera sp. FF02]|uniref:amino acid permease n=1 Tax=Candidatus Nitrososphaera sp. FF02 TaxID=3398226 RepID=UPI0039E93314
MSASADGGQRLPADARGQQLVRTLGLTDIVMVGIAAMIGGAIFVLTGPAIGLAGSAVIIALVINGIITLFTAMVYAELGSAMPEAGGGYLWIREGLPRPNAFISGWMAWFAHIVAGSLYAVGFGAFAHSLLQLGNLLPAEPLFGIFPYDKLIAVASVTAFTYVNVKGTSETGKAGNVITLAQLGAIVVIIGFGFWGLQNNPGWEQEFSEQLLPLGLGGMVAAMGLMFIAFEGYEVIVQTGEEVRNPKRNIPRAIFISLAVVVSLYCLMAFVALSATQAPEGMQAWQFIKEGEELGISKAVDLFMPYGGLVVLGGGIVSTLAALNATTFSSARVALAMGRNYNLPHRLSAIHPKNRTPYVATVVSGIIMAIMAYSLPLNDIALAAGVIFLLLFTQVNVAVITIRRIYGDKLDYGFKTPLFPLIPIIGIVLKLGLALYLLVTQPLSWGITVLWILVGFVLYRMYTFKKEVEHYAPIVTTEGTRERRGYRILLLFSPENPDRLAKYAIRFAKEAAGEVNVLRIITVPEQTPLSAGAAFAESAGRAFGSLEAVFEKEGVLNHYLVRISHDATEAMLATIEEQKINLLVADLETIRRNKKLLTLATCDIIAISAEDDELVLEPEHMQVQEDLEPHPVPAQEKKNMVVIYDGGAHSNLVLKITSWLEHAGRFKVDLVSVSKKDSEVEGSVAMKQDYLSQLGVDLTEVRMSTSVQESAANLFSAIDLYGPDVVLMSASVGRHGVFDSPQMLQMIRQLHCPVIIARDFGIPGVYRATSLMKRMLRQ